MRQKILQKNVGERWSSSPVAIHSGKLANTRLGYWANTVFAAENSMFEKRLEENMCFEYVFVYKWKIHGECCKVWMACFPMLLVITAEFDSWMSTKVGTEQDFFRFLRCKPWKPREWLCVFLSLEKFPVDFNVEVIMLSLEFRSTSVSSWQPCLRPQSNKSLSIWWRYPTWFLWVNL